MDPYIVLGSAVVGFLVGVTGAGGGALMTPMLILLFNVKPSTAISSDLVAAVVMRPIGAAIHLRQGTVNLRLVGWMTLGSAPMAFLGSYLLHLFGNAKAAENNVQIALGSALLVGAAAMIVRYVLDRRGGHVREGVVHDLTVRPLATLAVGMIGGMIVGITSVGSGSLIIVLLLFLYPMIGANQLVGTDLTQAVPLDRGGRPGGPDLRPRATVGDDLAHHRQRAGRHRRILPVLEGTGPLHPSGHHLRDPGVGTQVRRCGNHRPRLDPVLGPAGGGGLVAGVRPTVEEGPEECLGRSGHRRRGPVTSAANPGGPD